MKGFFEIADTRDNTVLIRVSAICSVMTERDATAIYLLDGNVLRTRESFDLVKILIRDASE